MRPKPAETEQGRIHQKQLLACSEGGIPHMLILLQKKYSKGHAVTQLLTSQLIINELQLIMS